MTKLDELIAERDLLNLEIEKLRDVSDEYAPTITTELSIDNSVVMEIDGKRLVVPKTKGTSSVTINIDIDNSTTNVTNNYKRSETNTNVTVGDSAVSMLGNLLGSIFDW